MTTNRVCSWLFSRPRHMQSDLVSCTQNANGKTDCIYTTYIRVRDYSTAYINDMNSPLYGLPAKAIRVAEAAAGDTVIHIICPSVIIIHILSGMCACVCL